jgi:membrane protease YdiL (CAAX protease family)
MNRAMDPVALSPPVREPTTDTGIAGLQVAFLAFAVAFLAAPFVQFIRARAALTDAEAQLLGRLFIFFVPLVAVLAIPRLRGACEELLRTPIRREHGPEVLGAAALHLASHFALAGAVATWYWLHGGGESVARNVFVREEVELARAFSWVGLAMIPVAGVLAPLIEEVVFRGFMFRAWARRWGWLTGMLLTALAFGLFHPYAAGAFVSSVIFTCLLRRTGSLWSSIAVHAIGNTLLWYPLMGRFILPSRSAGDIASLSTWGFNLACLAFVCVAVPVYVWMSRDGRRR